jgi:hypothetical protein
MEENVQKMLSTLLHSFYPLISFIAKAGLVIFFFPRVDILPEVWNPS